MLLQNIILWRWRYRTNFFCFFCL